MRGRHLVGLACASVSILTATAQAQLATEPAVTASLALEPELVASGAYLHPFVLPHGWLGAGAGLRLTPLVFSRGEFRVNLLGAGGFRTAGGWGAVCLLPAFVTRAGNVAGTFVGLGLELRCLPSYARGAWTAGLDLGGQTAIATHVHHAEVTRRTFDDRYPPGVTGVPGPRDGWYRFTSLRLRAGLFATLRRPSGWSWTVALGALPTRQDQGIYLPLLPFYLEVATSHAF